MIGEDLKYITALVDLAKEKNLKSLKFHALEFVFQDQRPEYQTVSGEAILPDEMPPDDQMLFYATEEYDRRQAELQDGMRPEENP